MPENDDFSLIAYLAADLRRVNTLLSKPVGAENTLKLWLGLFSPRFIPVLLCRIAHALARKKLTPVAKIFSLLNFFLFGIEIGLQCKIGKGLFLPHTQGTVIGASSIGENATIFQGVTLGARELDLSFQVSTRPILEDGVTIGSGAKILGEIVVGSGSSIGANSVVLESIPANVVAAGIPARIVKSF